jgi:hypothetical protein
VTFESTTRARRAFLASGSMPDTGVRAWLPNDDPKEVATLGAFERPHFIPSGNRRDPYDDPFDIASHALELGIHGEPIPLVDAPAFCSGHLPVAILCKPSSVRTMAAKTSLV